MPSSWRHIDTSSGALSSSRSCRSPVSSTRVCSRRTESEASTSECEAPGSGTPSDPIRHIDSPGTSSGSRLVASMRTSPVDRRRAPASFAAASTRCSQLSTMTSIWRSLSRSASDRSRLVPGRSDNPRAAAAACGTRLSSERAARSTTQVPSGYRHCVSRATSIASRVFPQPPGPASVTSRPPRRRALTSSSSRSRPTMHVAGGTMLVGDGGASSIATRARALRGRRSGSDASATASASRIARARAVGMAGHSSVAPGRGGFPVNKVWAVAASEKMSAARVGAAPDANSGAVYPGVARRGRCAAFNRWAVPKSTRTSRPSRVATKLEGLTSRWSTGGSWEWRWSSASAACPRYFTATSTSRPSGCVSSSLARLLPSTHSMTR